MSGIAELALMQRDLSRMREWAGCPVLQWIVLMEMEEGAWVGLMDRHEEINLQQRWMYVNSLAAERVYARAVADFDEAVAPIYSAGSGAGLRRLAELMKVHRVIFCLAVTVRGVMGDRDFEDVDMTTVFWANEMLAEFEREYGGTFELPFGVSKACN